MNTFSSRYVVAWLALFSMFGITAIVILSHFALQLAGAEFVRAAPRTETPTPAPTKFAMAVESPTPTPSKTPTIAPRPTATSTRKPTSTRAPTWTPTKTATVNPSTVPTTTPTLTPPRVTVGEKYGTLDVDPSPSDHSTAAVELNLAARGLAPAVGTLGLVDLDGPADTGAPQLFSLFADERVPTFNKIYQIRNWDWNCNCAGAPSADPEVSAVSVVVAPDEIIRVPRSSYYLGGDYQALVLYADDARITFNYTRTGNPLRGYTIYLEGVAIDGNLIARYRQTNGAGRAELPALQAGQAIGRARTREIQIAIRDAGAFMDPRSRKDWWRGK